MDARQRGPGFPAQLIHAPATHAATVPAQRADRALPGGDASRHPPNIGLAHSLAKNGASILPFLIERLARTDNDVDKEFLIVVFVAMQLSAYYPVSSDRTLMAFLEHQVSTMKDRDWKDMASESLERIRTAGAK